MTIELNIPDSIPLDPQVTVAFRAFLQAVVNRRCVGVLPFEPTAASATRAAFGV
jgi:hypothetical protein